MINSNLRRSYTDQLAHKHKKIKKYTRKSFTYWKKIITMEITRFKLKDRFVLRSGFRFCLTHPTHQKGRFVTTKCFTTYSWQKDVHDKSTYIWSVRKNVDDKENWNLMVSDDFKNRKKALVSVTLWATQTFKKNCDHVYDQTTQSSFSFPLTVSTDEWVSNTEHLVAESAIRKKYKPTKAT